jgi:hypothetical protein
MEVSPNRQKNKTQINLNNQILNFKWGAVTENSGWMEVPIDKKQNSNKSQ